MPRVTGVMQHFHMNEFTALASAGFSPCRICLTPSAQVLPPGLLDAAYCGDLVKIKQYIDGDNDVNAMYEKDCMLARACTGGQAEVVAFLLQCPEIHLNKINNGRTPLLLAARHGHFECMKLLLDSTLKCEPVIHSCWRGIQKFLATKPELKKRSAERILVSAGLSSQWEVVSTILETSHQFNKESCGHVITSAAYLQRWDVVREVLSRKFVGKDELLCKILPIAVGARCWENVEEVLRMMSDQYKFDIATAELVLSGDESVIKNLSSREDKQEINGALLLAAAGDTSQEIAQYLLSLRGFYDSDALKRSLFMATSRCSFKMFPLLLSHEEANYTFHDLSKINSELELFNVPQKRLLKEFYDNYLSKYQDPKTGCLTQKVQGS